MVAAKNEPRPDTIRVGISVDDLVDMEMLMVSVLVVVMATDDAADFDFLGPFDDVVGDILEIVIGVDIDKVEGPIGKICDRLQAKFGDESIIGVLVKLGSCLVVKTGKGLWADIIAVTPIGFPWINAVKLHLRVSLTENLGIFAGGDTDFNSGFKVQLMEPLG